MFFIVHVSGLCSVILAGKLTPYWICNLSVNSVANVLLLINVNRLHECVYVWTVWTFDLLSAYNLQIYLLSTDRVSDREDSIKRSLVNPQRRLPLIRTHPCYITVCSSRRQNPLQTSSGNCVCNTNSPNYRPHVYSPCTLSTTSRSSYYIAGSHI